MNHSLVEVTAERIAVRTLAIIENCVREEDRQDALEEFVKVARACVLEYERQAEQVRQCQ